MFVLMSDVEEDYMQNVQRLQLNIERMGPEERRRRKRQIEAEQYAVDILLGRVREGTGLDSFQVQSFSSDNLRDIIVNNEEMMSCTYRDFAYNKIACKHMYLLNRL